MKPRAFTSMAPEDESVSFVQPSTSSFESEPVRVEEIKTPIKEITENSTIGQKKQGRPKSAEPYVKKSVNINESNYKKICALAGIDYKGNENLCINTLLNEALELHSERINKILDL